VSSGIVDSLARPLGNATGFLNFEFSFGAKWLEVLIEIAPRLRRVAVMRWEQNSGNMGLFLAIQAAARSTDVEILLAPIRTSADVEDAIEAIPRDLSCGLVVLPAAPAGDKSQLIVDGAAAYHLPAVYPFRFFATDGGLMSYGVDQTDLYRKAASYVDRLLRGAKPVDLPVQAPTKFELVINIKTAKALGISVPQTLLARADEVIE
jgi:putative ABC transport system substrate-binding protein